MRDPQFERNLVVALDPDPVWARNPYEWSISGTSLCGHAESPELAFHDGLDAYIRFVNQQAKQAGWDG